MSVKAIAAVVEHAGAAPELREVELLELSPDEVLIRPDTVGICHSDVGWAAGQVYDRFPVVLGHEIAGIIESIGSAVTRFTPGDRVVVALAHHCGHCKFCASGRPILCERRVEDRHRITVDGRPVLQAFGTGGFADRVIVAASSVVPLPDDVPMDVAATTGCALATGLGSVFNVAEVQYGASVAVLGAGAVGLTVVMGCVAAGADQIVVADPDPRRRQVALEVGATAVVEPEEDALREIAPSGFEYVFESAGVTPAMELAVGLTERGGTTVLIGVPRPGSRLTLDALGLVTGGRRLLGSLNGNIRPHMDFDRYFRLYQHGRLPLDRLITGVVEFADIADGFTRAASGVGIKTIVKIGTE